MTPTQSATLTVTPTPNAPLLLSANVFYPNLAPLQMEGLIQANGDLRVSVYNVVGERIADVIALKGVAGQNFAGTWDGRNARGELVGNGLYLVVLRAPAGIVIQKVIILK